MARSAIECGELLPAGGDLGGIERELFPVERTHDLAAMFEAIPRDGAALLTGRSPLNLELGFAAALEIDHFQFMEAGLEGDGAVLFSGRMDTVIIQERSAIDGQLGAVVRSDPEAVLAIGRDVDEPGETDAPVVVGVRQAQVEGGGNPSGFRGHGQQLADGTGRSLEEFVLKPIDHGRCLGRRVVGGDLITQQVESDGSGL